MSDAPLIAIPGQPEPPGGRAFYIAAADGVSLRVAHWPVARLGDPPLGGGTAFLLGGRTEFIEKYADAAHALVSRGYQVLAMDWRGQGLSDRLLPDRLRGHVARFADFDRDLDALAGYAKSIDAPRPWIVVAHSMGGHNALRHAAGGSSPFDALALSAPMCRIHLPPPGFLIRALVYLGAYFAPNAYAFGQVPPGPADEVFEKNNLTSDAGRFAVMVKAWRLEPRLQLGGVTFGWLAQALSSMAFLRKAQSLARITMPVMIAAAMADKIVDPAAYPAMVKHMPKAQLVPIDGSKHEILREADRYRTQFWAGFDRLTQSLGK